MGLRRRVKLGSGPKDSSSGHAARGSPLALRQRVQDRLRIERSNRDRRVGSTNFRATGLATSMRLRPFQNQVAVFLGRVLPREMPRIKNLQPRV